MGDKIKKSNINNVSGNVFIGPTNIYSGNNLLNGEKIENIAEYEAEPVWRSSITMGLLTWIGFIIAIIDIFPFYKIIEPLINILRDKSIDAIPDNKLYAIFFISLMLLLLIVLALRKITKNETRYPLFFNYAINGFGNKITLEKVRVGECPICGGEMKYFNKPCLLYTSPSPRDS